VVLTALGDFIGVEDMPAEWLDDGVIDLNVEIAFQEVVLPPVEISCKKLRKALRLRR
jgi:hypothetical protein